MVAIHMPVENVRTNKCNNNVRNLDFKASIIYTYYTVYSHISIPNKGYSNIYIYCDLRGRIKGTACALYPVFVERALWPILSGHKAR